MTPAERAELDGFVVTESIYFYGALKKRGDAQGARRFARSTHWSWLSLTWRAGMGLRGADGSRLAPAQLERALEQLVEECAP